MPYNVLFGAPSHQHNSFLGLFFFRQVGACQCNCRHIPWCAHANEGAAIGSPKWNSSIPCKTVVEWFHYSSKCYVLIRIIESLHGKFFTMILGGQVGHRNCVLHCEAAHRKLENSLYLAYHSGMCDEDKYLKIFCTRLLKLLRDLSLAEPPVMQNDAVAIARSVGRAGRGLPCHRSQIS